MQCEYICVRVCVSMAWLTFDAHKLIYTLIHVYTISRHIDGGSENIRSVPTSNARYKLVRWLSLFSVYIVHTHTHLHESNIYVYMYFVCDKNFMSVNINGKNNLFACVYVIRYIYGTVSISVHLFIYLYSFLV